jgi:cyclic-di-GMP-binding protein
MAATPPAGLKSGSLFFSDARSCKDWLRAIPLTNVAQAQQKIVDALRMLNADGRFPAMERLTSMELMRDKVSFLLAEQRSRAVGKTLPLASGDLTAWSVSTQLITEMEAGYRRCYQDAQGDASELAQHAALIIQRVIRYIGLSMLMAGFIYRRFDHNVWMRLHLQLIEADARGVTHTKVKDSVGTAEGYSSVAQAYTAVVLGQAANVYSLTPREMNFVDFILKRFGHKVLLEKTLPAETDPKLTPLAVDLLSNAGAVFYQPGITGEHVRLLITEGMSKSIRRRIKKLSLGEDVASLDLPADWSADECSAMLSRLHRRWCDSSAERPVATIPAEHNAIVAFGIAETHFFLSGDLFEQPDVKRQMSRQELSDIAMFGRVSESTIRARYAEFNYGCETWAVVDEARGQLRLIRPANSSRMLSIGLLVGVRVSTTTDISSGSSDFYLGVIRELVEDTSGLFTVSLTMLPGRPEATAVRATDNKERTSTFTQGFRLPPMEALGVPETLIVPANFAARGRGIDIFHPGHGSAKQVNVRDFIERGVDFDRVTIGG